MKKTVSFPKNINNCVTRFSKALRDMEYHPLFLFLIKKECPFHYIGHLEFLFPGLLFSFFRSHCSHGNIERKTHTLIFSYIFHSKNSLTAPNFKKTIHKFTVDSNTINFIYVTKVKLLNV